MHKKINLNEEPAHAPAPSVSIGLFVYNGSLYLRETLDSLLNQTYSDFELIISDNASTDSTGQICKEYMSKHRRIQYFRQSHNIGAINNISAVFEKAQGKYFMWAACDDIYDKSFLRILIDTMENNNSVIAFCPYQAIDHGGKYIDSIRSFDYSAPSIILQLYKFIYSYDDACFYGLYRRESIKRIKFPNWWSVNNEVAMNCAYPPLFYVLSSGKFSFSNTPYLYFNRMHNNHHFKTCPPLRTRLSRYLAYVLRKINVLYESIISVYRGSRSLTLTMAVLLPLAMRCAFDISAPILEKIRRNQ